ncbi:hypothetical protein CRV24_002263 [Beauveria bassiana]|nr:hypothetical protein CRV24_002263 [Beauveria bassiana]
MISLPIFVTITNCPSFPAVNLYIAPSPCYAVADTDLQSFGKTRLDSSRSDAHGFRNPPTLVAIQEVTALTDIYRAKLSLPTKEPLGIPGSLLPYRLDPDARAIPDELLTGALAAQTVYGK